jgi:hypothetical protein
MILQLTRKTSRIAGPDVAPIELENLPPVIAGDRRGSGDALLVSIVLDLISDDSVNRMVEINVPKLGEIAAKGTSHKYAEEFLQAASNIRSPPVT